MCARHRAQPDWILQTGEADKLLDIDLIGAAGFGIGDVSEPFELRGYVGELDCTAQELTSLY